MTKPLFSFDILFRGLRPLEVVGAPVDLDVFFTDTRRPAKGGGFFALAGEHFDAHDYLEQAIAAGARVLIVSRREGLEELSRRHPEVTIFLVRDTLTALGDLAALWRRTRSPQVIGITGSNGKTSTKEMTAAICAPHRPTLKTVGNFNNLIGLPLTLLDLRDETLAVLEMGMSLPGEIARLAEIAAPEVAVITQVGEAHLEGLGDARGVMAAKGELFEALASDAVAVVNLDNPYTVELADTRLAARGVRKFTISLRNPAADLLATRIDPTAQGHRVLVRAEGRTVEVNIPLPGYHNVSNALCAMAAAHAVGIPYEVMAEGLATCTLPGHRLKIHAIGPWTVIDDCYNANPASMRAALELLIQRRGEGRAVAVLGDMLELGTHAERLHRELGEEAATVDRLGVFGDYAGIVAQGAAQRGLADAQVHATADMNDLIAWLREVLKPRDVLLVKGSRGSRMERVLDALTAMCGEDA